VMNVFRGAVGVGLAYGRSLYYGPHRHVVTLLSYLTVAACLLGGKWVWLGELIRSIYILCMDSLRVTFLAVFMSITDSRF
jgi:hypothetical protein